MKNLLSGRQLPNSMFKTLTVDGHLPLKGLGALMAGDAVAIHVKNYVSSNISESLTAAFGKVANSQRVDGVAAIEVGSGHFGKTVPEYKTSVKASKKLFDQFSGVAGFDVGKKIMSDVASALPSGLKLRLARCDDVEVNHARAVQWAGADEGLALQVHEDRSQLHAAAQSSLEIQSVSIPVAFNLYPSVAHSGGALKVYNLQPDSQCRRLLGVSETGYPYNTALLNQVKSLEIVPSAGDLVLLCGAFLHGVTVASGGIRIVVNGFFGRADVNEVLWWV
jgi:L-isoleucine 31-dioxygenase